MFTFAAQEHFWLTPVANTPQAGWNTSHLGDSILTGSADPGWAGYKGGYSVTATEAGYIYQIQSYLNIFTSSATTRAAIYADNGSGAPGALLARSDDQVVAPGSGQAITWNLRKEVH